MFAYQRYFLSLYISIFWTINSVGSFLTHPIINKYNIFKTKLQEACICIYANWIHMYVCVPFTFMRVHAPLTPSRHILIVISIQFAAALFIFLCKRSFCCFTQFTNSSSNFSLIIFIFFFFLIFVLQIVRWLFLLCISFCDFAPNKQLTQMRAYEYN